jgi:hypothetical protein
MADKGFDLKVLIPTDDGLTISENGIENALYYLSYNISDRSYQLAEKYKADEIFESNIFNWQEIKELCSQNKIDKFLCINSISQNSLEYLVVEKNEISVILNILIDQINNNLLNNT